MRKPYGIMGSLSTALIDPSLGRWVTRIPKHTGKLARAIRRARTREALKRNGMKGTNVYDW